MDADLKPIDTRIVKRASDKENKRMTKNLIAQNDNKNEMHVGKFGWFSDMVLVGDWGWKNVTNMLMGGAKPRYLRNLKGTDITVDFQHMPSRNPSADKWSKTLAKLLSRPPHKLTDAEIASFNTRDKRKVKVSAETAKLGGVMVLKTYYTYLKSGERELEVEHVDTSKGIDYYTIYFKGPTADFDKHLATIEKSLKTIR